MPVPEPVVDREAEQEFARRMVGIYTGAVLTKLIDLGTQVGLFEAAAAGPATCAGLAGRAGLQDRYVREWLGAMVAGGIFEYDPASGSYELPRERAELLSGGSSRNLAPMSQGIDQLRKAPIRAGRVLPLWGRCALLRVSPGVHRAYG